jgi:hypothetical protein
MAIVKQLKPRKCKSCNEVYIPERPLQHVCSPLCAFEAAKLQRIKTDRKEHREKKLKMKPRSEWLKDAQEIVNRFIRLRDAGKPCISCNKPMLKKVNAGHYKSVGAHPELRFNEFNINSQCEACNTHLSGNIVNYRINLINKIGVDAVEDLEGPHDPLKLTIDEIKQLIATYKLKIKQLGE